MAISLNNIPLPDDIQWTDEFNGYGVGQTVTRTLTGAMVIEESAQTSGRRITLASNGAAWVTQSVASQIQALAATPLDGTTLTLDWNGTPYNVVFDRSRGGFATREVLRLADAAQTSDHNYLIEINLITA